MTRLKVAPNMADPISIKRTDSRLKVHKYKRKWLTYLICIVACFVFSILNFAHFLFFFFQCFLHFNPCFLLSVLISVFFSPPDISFICFLSLLDDLPRNNNISNISVDPRAGPKFDRGGICNHLHVVQSLTYFDLS